MIKVNSKMNNFHFHVMMYAMRFVVLSDYAIPIVSGFSFKTVEGAKSYRNPSIAKEERHRQGYTAITRKMVNAGRFEVKFGLSVYFIMRG